MSKETVALAKRVTLTGTTPDDLRIQHRGDVAALQAQLDAANERNRALAADLSRMAQENAAQALIIALAADLPRLVQENAAQAQIIFKQNHELDRLRQHLRGLNRVIGSVLVDGEIEYSADGCDGCGDRR